MMGDLYVIFDAESEYAFIISISLTVFEIFDFKVEFRIKMSSNRPLSGRLSVIDIYLTKLNRIDF